MHRLAFVHVLAALLLGAPGARAERPVVGAPAPAFALPASTGGTVRLDDLRAKGRSVVLAFFPKAFTGG